MDTAGSAKPAIKVEMPTVASPATAKKPARAAAPATAKPVAAKTPAKKALVKKAVVTKAPAAKAVKPLAKPAAKPAPKSAPKAVTKTRPVTPKAAAAAPAKEEKSKKPVVKKPRLVRDSFTFPQSDYALIAVLKQRALTSGREIKKSEVLRAGLAALGALGEADLLKALDGVERIKTGRPSK